MRKGEQKIHIYALGRQNLDPLLSVLRTELGLDWGAYNEFLGGAQDAIISGENFATWTDQMAPLIQKPVAQVAHEGVLFLLRDLEWRFRPSSNTAAASHSPSLTANHSSRPHTKNGTTVPPPTPPSIQPSMDVTLRSVNKNSQRAPFGSASGAQIIHSRSASSSRMLPPSPVSPARPTPTPTPAPQSPSIPIISPPKPRANPMRKPPTMRSTMRSTMQRDPVFFVDATFQHAVQEYFWRTTTTANNAWMYVVPMTVDPAPRYNPADDDLLVWKKKKKKNE